MGSLGKFGEVEYIETQVAFEVLLGRLAGLTGEKTWYDTAGSAEN